MLGAGGEPARKGWIALARSARPWTSAHVQILVVRTARFLCLAQFCDWDANERTEPGSLAPEKVGQELAIVTFVYDAAPNGAGGSQTL